MNCQHNAIRMPKSYLETQSVLEQGDKKLFYPVSFLVECDQCNMIIGNVKLNISDWSNTVYPVFSPEELENKRVVFY